MMASDKDGKPEHSPDEYAKLFTDMPEKDKQILKEIQAESFWKAAMPLSASVMALTGVLGKYGKIKPHPRFGFTPKIIAGGFIGFFTGKTIYFSTIQQRILDRMPDSDLAAVIRNKGKLNTRTNNPDDISMADAPSKVKPYGDMPEFRGLDDNQRPSMDRNVKDNSEQEAGGQRSITYDDLRRQNRSQSGRDEPQINRNNDQIPQDTPAPPPPPPPQEKKIRRNKWGDPIED